MAKLVMIRSGGIVAILALLLAIIFLIAFLPLILAALLLIAGAAGITAITGRKRKLKKQHQPSKNSGKEKAIDAEYKIR